MVRAIGSLLGKTSEWGLDDEGHRNIGGSRRSTPSEPRKVEPLPKSSQDAKERGNLALASGLYDVAVCMYSIGIAHENQNHVLYSNRLVRVPYRRPSMHMYSARSAVDLSNPQQINVATYLYRIVARQWMARC